MPDTYRASVGLTLANGQRIEAGENTTATLPPWLVEQGHVELVASAPQPMPAIAPQPASIIPAPIDAAPDTEATQ